MVSPGLVLSLSAPITSKLVQRLDNPEAQLRRRSPFVSAVLFVIDIDPRQALTSDQAKVHLQAPLLYYRWYNPGCARAYTLLLVYDICAQKLYCE